jgi:hypothetical protein
VTTTRILAVNGLEPPDCDPLAEDAVDDDGTFWELDGEPDDDVPCLVEQIDSARR